MDAGAEKQSKGLSEMESLRVGGVHGDVALGRKVPPISHKRGTPHRIIGKQNVFGKQAVHSQGQAGKAAQVRIIC